MLTKYNTDLAQITIFHLSYKYLKKKINTSISIKHFLISYYLTIDVGSLAIVIVWWTVVGHPRLYPPGRRSRVSIPTKGNKELYTQPCKVKTGDIIKVYMIFTRPQPWSSRFTYFTPVYAHDPDCHIYMPLDQSVHHAWQVYVLDPGCHMYDLAQVVTFTCPWISPPCMASVCPWPWLSHVRPWPRLSHLQVLVSVHHAWQVYFLDPGCHMYVFDLHVHNQTWVSDADGLTVLDICLYTWAVQQNSSQICFAHHAAKTTSCQCYTKTGQVGY